MFRLFLSLALIAFSAVGHDTESVDGRPESWGPGFSYRVSGPLEITKGQPVAKLLETGESFKIQAGDQISMILDGETLVSTADSDQAKIDALLAGKSGTETTLIIARKKQVTQNGKKFTRNESFVVTIPRTVPKAGNFYPDFDFRVQATVRVRDVFPDSPADKVAGLSNGRLITSVGKDPKQMIPLEGDNVAKIASEHLRGAPGGSTYLSLEHGPPFKIELSPDPRPHPEVEFLPPPPTPIDEEARIPAIEDSRGCYLRPMEELVRQVVTKIPEGDMIKRNFDDKLSEQLHAAFLKSLDPERLYFQQAEIDAFAKEATHHDDQLKAGVPWFPFRVQSALSKRVEKVVGWVEKSLAEEFDPAAEIKFKADRSKADYAKSDAESEALWKLKARRDVVEQMSQGIPLGEAKDIVRQKYRRVLAGHQNRCTGRILEEFLSIFAHLFGPFTNYYSPFIAEQMQSHREVAMCGIGVYLSVRDERIIVDGVGPKSPAAKAGLQIGDEVVVLGHAKTDRITVDEMGTDRVMDKFVGPCDSPLYLGIKRKGTPGIVDVNLTRAPFSEEDVRASGHLFEVPAAKGRPKRKVGVLRLPNFYEGGLGNSGADDVQRLLEGKLKDADGIILDLRGNPGGSLAISTEIGGLFIGSGPISRTSDGTTATTQSASRPRPAFNKALVVLVDRNSVSAAEILAAAIQDHRRGVVVGDQTVGKAQAQNVFGVRENFYYNDPLGAYKVSKGAYYRATGESPLRIGVIPDILAPTGEQKIERLEEALATLPDFPPVASALEKPTGNLTSRDIEYVKKAHERRVSSSLRKLSAWEAGKPGALVADGFSLAKFKEEKAREKEHRDLVNRVVPSSLNSVADFNAKEYGQEAINIAVDLIERTRTRTP